MTSCLNSVYGTLIGLGPGKKTRVRRMFARMMRTKKSQIRRGGPGAGVGRLGGSGPRAGGRESCFTGRSGAIPSSLHGPGRSRGLPGERDSNLRRQLRSLARETESIVHLEQGVRRELPLDLDDSGDLILLALDGQDRAPPRRKALQVLERILAERDLSFVRLVFHGCARRERAEVEAARQPDALDQLPVLRPDDLPVLLERKDGLEVAPQLRLLVRLL